MVEAACQRIYAETGEFYRTIARGQEEDLGFQILYGPPYVDAPIMFLGYQPGGGRTSSKTKSPQEERAYGSEDGWPAVCEYATESWALARSLRSVFGADFLSRCVGLNAIFLRAPDVAHYEATYGRREREEIWRFCQPRVAAIIELLRPRSIVVIGLDTLELFSPSTPEVTSPRGRVLARRARLFGVEALGILHLSGAWIAAADRRLIADALRRLPRPCAPGP